MDWRLKVARHLCLTMAALHRCLSPCHDFLSGYSVLHPLAAISGLTFCGANKTRRKTEHLLDWDSLHRSGQEHGSLAPRNVLVGRPSVEVGAGQVVPDQLEQRKQRMFHTTVEISGRTLDSPTFDGFQRWQHPQETISCSSLDNEAKRHNAWDPGVDLVTCLVFPLIVCVYKVKSCQVLRTVTVQGFACLDKITTSFEPFHCSGGYIDH